METTASRVKLRIAIAVILSVLAILYWALVDGTNRANGSLSCVDIGIDEHHFPVRLAVRVQNDGEVPATVTAADVTFSWQHLLAGMDATNVPERIAYVVVAPDSDVFLKPGESVGIVVAVEWELPPNPDSMLALVHSEGVTLTLANGDTIRSIPITFVLKSKDSLEVPSSAPSSVVNQINALPGYKAPSIQKLINN